MKLTVDYIESLLKSLGFLAVSGRHQVFQKEYFYSYIVTVDIPNRKISYPLPISVGRDTICNFSKEENLVVLECVDRLLTIGYKPESLTLEKRYRGGWIDILIYNENFKNDDTKGQYAIIECKTSGKELLQFIFYVLQFKQADIYKFAKGNAQPHLYEQDIYKLQIPMPQDEEIIHNVVKECNAIDSDKSRSESYRLHKKKEILVKLLEIS